MSRDIQEGDRRGGAERDKRESRGTASMTGREGRKGGDEETPFLGDCGSGSLACVEIPLELGIYRYFHHLHTYIERAKFFPLPRDILVTLGDMRIRNNALGNGRSTKDLVVILGGRRNGHNSHDEEVDGTPYLLVGAP